MTANRVLRMNQGDASEARIYYCAHFVAEALGFFREANLTVHFTATQSGGTTIQGGQIPAVLSGAADLTIGGPMVTMKNHEDGGLPLVNFCAAVEANPWFLAARQPATGFSVEDLKGKRIIDVGNVGTASLCFRWLLKKHDLGEVDVTLIAGSGNEARDFATVSTGEIDYALHSLHALAPAIAAGQLGLVASLAGPTGAVPWSAYIARPELLAKRRADFAAFAGAIGRALGWIRANDASTVAGIVQPYYPDYPGVALVIAIKGYQDSSVFASTTAISQRDFDHFAAILREAGWLKGSVPYAALVDTSLIAPSATEDAR